MVVTPVSRLLASLGSAVQVRIGTLGASFASLIYMHLVYTTKYSPCYNCITPSSSLDSAVPSCVSQSGRAHVHS